MNDNQQELKQGWKKHLLLLLGYASSKRDLENVFRMQEQGSMLSGFLQFCHESLCIREKTVIAAEEVIL